MARTRPLVVEQEYYFEASPRKVFAALTKPKKLVKWFLVDAKIKPKEGTGYTFTWEGGASHVGKVKKVVIDRALVLTWPDNIKGKIYETEATFTLRPKGDGTLLKITHVGFKEGDDWIWLYGAVQSGWAYYMTNLKSVLMEGVDLRSKHDKIS